MALALMKWQSGDQPRLRPQSGVNEKKVEENLPRDTYLKMNSRSCACLCRCGCVHACVGVGVCVGVRVCRGPVRGDGSASSSGSA